MRPQRTRIKIRDGPIFSRGGGERGGPKVLTKSGLKQTDRQTKKRSTIAQIVRSLQMCFHFCFVKNVLFWRMLGE